MTKQKVSASLIIFFCLFFLSPPLRSSAETSSIEFSDPDIHFEMDDKWKARPMAHPAEFHNKDLVITLNQQFMQLAPYIEEFAHQNNITVRISEGTCGISAGGLARKELDIAGFCCPPGPTDRLPNIRFHTIGIHPVSIFVNKENPVDSLTFRQVRDIFAGDIVYWSEVGGTRNPSLPVARLHCKIRPGHWRLLLDSEDQFSPTTRTVGGIEDMFSYVDYNAGSIGFEVMWLKDKYKNIKALRIDGLDPEDLDALLRHEYPVYRVLYLTTWTNGNGENPLAAALIKHIQMRIDQNGREMGMIPASELRRAGWKFRDQELIGAPD